MEKEYNCKEPIESAREHERRETLSVYIKDLKETKESYMQKIDTINKEIRDAVVEMQEIICF